MRLCIYLGNTYSVEGLWLQLLSDVGNRVRNHHGPPVECVLHSLRGKKHHGLTSHYLKPRVTLGLTPVFSHTHTHEHTPWATQPVDTVLWQRSWSWAAASTCTCSWWFWLLCWCCMHTGCPVRSRRYKLKCWLSVHTSLSSSGNLPVFWRSVNLFR